MKPAARLTDNHTCPQQAPAPHVGGPIAGPGEPSVRLQHLPGAVLGDACVCPPAPAPDAIVSASASVFYKGKPAARMDDKTAHGGLVVVPGGTTVFIGR